MTKKLLLLTGAIAAWLLIPSFTQAADLNVVCTGNDDPCVITPTNVPLFVQDNLVPGDTISKEVAIKNDNDFTCTPHLRVEDLQGNTLAGKLLNTISGSSVINESLIGLENVEIPLESISTGDTTTYVWDVIFDMSAGNEYQDTTSSFSFALDFRCPQVAGAMDDQGSKSGQALGTLSEKVSKVLGLSSFPKAGVAIQKFISFFIVGLVSLLLLFKYILPWYTKKSSRR